MNLFAMIPVTVFCVVACYLMVVLDSISQGANPSRFTVKNLLWLTTVLAVTAASLAATLR
jgi:hypothetical protein